MRGHNPIRPNHLWRGGLSAAALALALTAASSARAGFETQDCNATICQCDDPRFLCNGVSADGFGGVIQGDFCGTIASCNANTAARWEPAIVDYTYDRNTVPSGITTTQWATIITQARDNWTNPAGGGLQLNDAGASTTHDFSGQNGQNNQFFTTSSTEWSQMTGSNASDGVLGVTITPYGCVSATERSAIFETDTVLNGVSNFVSWCVSGCDQFNGDVSVLGVLTHEQGHGLGFDHPAEFCDDVIMSALDSGLTSPQAVDIEALLALYDIAPGALGSPCGVDGDCDLSLCLTVDDTSFCSQTCAGTCPNGMECLNVTGEGDVCVFAGLGAAGIGQLCGAPDDCADACVTGIDPGCNLCVGPQGQSTCEAACIASTNEGCNASQFCLDFEDADFPDRGVCLTGEIVGRGEVCDDDSFCDPGDGLLCVGTAAAATCLGSCNSSTGAGCLATENCFDLASPGTIEGACFPGGPGQVGDTCADVEDCDAGLTCAFSLESCQTRCDQNFPDCPAGQTCVANSGIGSFCSAGGEGEGEGEEGEGEEGEGEGPPPPGECRIARGNFDCPNGQGCVVANEDDDVGLCEDGANGDEKTFSLCEEDDDCDSGLCRKGVCTRPCDVDDCPDNWSCEEEDDVPAGEPDGDPGVCVPDSCQDDYEACDADDGFYCTYSETNNYVCAKDGEPLGCNCGSTADPRATFAMFGVLALVFRARRRRT